MNLGSLNIHLLADVSQYTRAMNKASARLDKMGKKFRRTGRSMSLYVTAPLAIVGGAAVKAFANFDDAMTQSLAIMDDVGPVMRKEMEDTAKVMSSQTITSATDLAKSYFFLASAGLDAEQSVAALGTVNRFGIAGMFDMATATDLLTDAQSALGLTVADSNQNMLNMTRVSDVLVKANTLANATVQQFSTALTSKAGTAMKSYNIKMEEGVAVLAAYADQGIKAQLAGNMFARMLRLLIKGVNDNAGAFKKLGIRTRNAQGDLAPIADIMEDIGKATAGMGAIQKSATLKMLGFEARIQGAILPLLGLEENIRRYQDSLEKAGGITQKVSDKQMKSFSSQMKILWNNVKLVGIEIGQMLAPWILKLGGYVKQATTWFRNLNETQKQWILIIAGAVAAIGPLLIILGFVASAIGSIIGLFTMFGGIIPIILAAGAAIWTIYDAMNDTTFIFSEWEWGIEKVMAMLLTLEIVATEVAATMYRVFLKSVRGVTAIVTLGMSELFDSTDLFGYEVEASLRNTENRWKQYYDKIGKLDEDYRKKIAKKEKDYLIGAFAKMSGKRPQMVAPKFEMPEFKMPEFKTADKASQQMGQQISLRRFSLESPTTAKKKEQEVQDKTVAALLGTIIEKMSETKVSVLG